MASPIKSEEITRGVYLAWRLFARDRGAVELIDDSYRGVLKSFWCAAVILPLVLGKWALQAAVESDAAGNFGNLVAHSGLSRTLSVLALFYIIRWTIWPVIMHWVAPFLDCDRYYFRYIAAYNWSAFVVAVLAILYTLLKFLGLLPEDYEKTISFAFLAVMWIYHWFILRVTLEVNDGYAALLVAGEFLMSVMLSHLSAAVIR